jgi:hypothetical protein
VIRVYDDAGNVIDTHEHMGEFKEPWRLFQAGAVSQVAVKNNYGYR